MKLYYLLVIILLIHYCNGEAPWLSTNLKTLADRQGNPITGITKIVATDDYNLEDPIYSIAISTSTYFYSLPLVIVLFNNEATKLYGSNVPDTFTVTNGGAVNSVIYMTSSKVGIALLGNFPTLFDTPLVSTSSPTQNLYFLPKTLTGESSDYVLLSYSLVNGVQQYNLFPVIGIFFNQIQPLNKTFTAASPDIYSFYDGGIYIYSFTSANTISKTHVFGTIPTIFSSDLGFTPSVGFAVSNNSKVFVAYVDSTNGGGYLNVYTSAFVLINSSPILLGADIVTFHDVTYDRAKDMIFFSVLFSNGNFGVVTTPSTGSVVKTKNMGIDSTNGQFRAISVYPPDSAIYLVSTNGSLQAIQYSSLCENNCNNQGTCSGTVCTCYAQYAGNACQAIKPIINTITGAEFYIDSIITLIGSSLNHGTFTVSINGSTCAPGNSSQDGTSLTCTFSASEASSFNPLEAQAINVNFPDLSFQYPEFTYKIFPQPIITLVSQPFQNLRIDGSGLYYNFLTAFLNNVALSISVVSDSTMWSIVSFNGPSNNLTISSHSGTVYYNEYLVLRPQVYFTNQVPTTSTNLTVTGKFFTATPNLNYTLRLGTTPNFVLVPVVPVNDTIIISEIPQLTQCTNNVNILTSYPSSSSNQSDIIGIQYFSATITNYTQITPSNQVVFSGTNFGFNLTFCTYIVTSGDPIYLLSGTQTEITFKLPPTVYSRVITISTLFITIDVPLNLKPKILSITKPPIIGGNLTITGEYLNGTLISHDSTLLDSCEFVGASNYPATIICQNFPAGSGTFTLSSVSKLAGTDDQESDIFNTSYHPPIISEISPKSYSKGISTQFTLTGTNFDVNSTVIINGENCTLSTDTVPTGNIYCTLLSNIDPTLVTNPVSVSVTFDSVVGFLNTTLIYQKPCPNQCTNINQGACQYSTGKCKCSELYQGDDCSDLKTDNISSSTKLTSSSIIILLSFILFYII
ncbi:contact site A protein [Tieghemostelium lacteum]|uniref:Contact site A protein n=1 Tax=Tieghemostelium lacteum TaxID=361077 RepID=A0A151ZHH0_TIELA|nr:contact site A protein [Tieghemostelium lacteum]|eukprot:KYQ93422.1 contact site A protein [Tieghemostelium lacteum]